MSENNCVWIVLGVICCVVIGIAVLTLALGFGLGFGLKPHNMESMDFNTTQNVSFSVTVV